MSLLGEGREQLPVTTVAPADDTGIRQATRADLLDVVRIERSVFTAPWTLSAFERFLGAPGFLVSDATGSTGVGGTIRGYVVATGIRVNGNPVGHVKDFAVAPEYQGQGIGTRLLDRGLAVLARQGYRRVRLEVRESNEAAIRLYRRFGFRYATTHPNYYPDGEDAAILVADIADREGF